LNEETSVSYDEKRSKEYVAIHFKLSLFETITKVILIILFLFSGWSLELREFAESYTDSYYGSILIYFFTLFIIAELLFFPIDFYSGYILEHKYNLSNQTVGKYFFETGKGLLIGILFNTVFLCIFYYLLHNYPENWWFIAFLVLFVFMILMANLAPVLLFPLFYTFTPLKNEELKRKLTVLSENNGVKVNGIFEMDMSKNTKKANAALAGIGNTKRIILSDTLLKDFTEDEIETIIAHELGHKNHNHIIKLMGVQTLLMFLVFYLSDIVLKTYYESFHFRGIDDIAALPLLLITLTVVSLVAMPLANSLSRFFEKQADLFALKATGKAKSFISAMERLAAINLAEKEPNKIKEFLFYSHPSIAKRVALAQEFQRNKE